MKTALLSFSFFFLLSISLFAQPETVVQFGHIGYNVRDMALSPDGHFMASTDGKILKIWDMDAGLEYRTKAGKGGIFMDISSLSFSVDGEHILYQESGEIKVMNVISGENKSSWSFEEETIGREEEDDDEKEPSKEDIEEMTTMEGYYGCAYSPDHRLIALGKKGHVEIIDARTDQLHNDLSITTQDADILDKLAGIKTPLEIAFGNQLILVDTAVYDINDKKQLYIINNKEARFDVRQAKFSKDGQQLFLVGYVKKETKGENEQAFSLRDIMRAADDHAQSKIDYGLMMVLNANTGEVINRLETTPAFSMGLSLDGQKMSVVHTKGVLNIYDTKDLKVIQTLSYKKEQLGILAGLFGKSPPLVFSNDNKSLYLGGQCREQYDIVQYDVESGEELRPLGAAIPTIVLKPEVNKSDSIILKEIENVAGPILFFPVNQIDKGFRMLDLLTAKVPNAFAKFEEIVFSPNKTYYLAQRKEEHIRIYTTEFDMEVAALESSDSYYDDMAFSPNGKWVGGITGNIVHIWDTESGEFQHRLTGHDSQIRSIDFSTDESMAFTTSKDETVKFWSMEDGDMISEQKAKTKVKEVAKEAKKVLGKFKDLSSTIPLRRNRNKVKQTEQVVTAVAFAADFLDYSNYNDVTVSDDGQMAALWGNDYATVHFYDTKKQGIVRKIRDNSIYAMRKLLMGNMTEEIFAASSENVDADSISSAEDQEMMGTFIQLYFEKEYNLRNKSAISPDWKRYARSVKPLRAKKEAHIKIEYIVKPKKGKKKYKLDNSDKHTESIVFSPNGKMIAGSSMAQHSIRIWDAETGAIIKDLPGHSGDISFGPNNKILISKGWDKQIKIWDIEKEKVVYSFIGIKGENDYVVLLPSGHYTASRKNSNAIAFRKGNRVYPFEQFDLQFNRPDMILSTLNKTSTKQLPGQSNNTLIDAYGKAYQKRLELLGLTEASFNANAAVPEASLADIPLTSNTKTMAVRFTATDQEYPLTNVNLYVNGVPVYGRNGKDLQSKNSKSYSGSENITLNQGRNIIQLRAINSKGVASMMDQSIVTCKATPVTPKIHLVLVGASNFADPKVTPLDYPVKDLQDIAKLFEKNKQGLQVVQHQLFNDQFTTSNFQQLKTKLDQTGVDDQVLVFFSSHGMLDGKLNYYIATHNISATTPSTNGLSMSHIEDLLDAIPSRNKAVFIDACHAGEVDKSANRSIKNKNTVVGKVTFKSLGTMSWGEAGKLSDIEQMKNLFVGLRKNTGSTVIASAGSGQYAVEGAQWNNSVFTYALTAGLKEMQADLNHDKVVTISELQQYLPRKVSRLTNGGQLPTFRDENILGDFRVW